MPIKNIMFPTRRPKGKQPRVTIAIEPRVAKLFRELARVEHMQLSPLLEQALMAWIRRWRPEYELLVDGPEGPEVTRGVVQVGGAGPPTTASKSRGPSVGRAHRITSAEAESYGDFEPNPPRSPARPADDETTRPAMPRRKFAKKDDKGSARGYSRAPNRRGRRPGPKKR